MKRLTYVTTDAFTYRIDIHDHIEIPQGSFITPMEDRWVPKEVKNRLAKPTIHEVYVYTKYGFIVIPKKLIGTTYD